MNSILSRTNDIFSTAYGWLYAAALFVLNFVADHQQVRIVLVVVFLDAFWGTIAAIKQKRFTLSNLARDSIKKLSIYGTALWAFMELDATNPMNFEITSIVICTWISIIEIWSMAGAMSIVFPKDRFLKSLRPILAGEIAKKLNTTPDKVEQILNGEEDETD